MSPSAISAFSARPRRDRGIALLMALLVLVILIILIGQMVISSMHDKVVASNSSSDLQNSYGVKSGFHQARLYLEADKDPAVDSVNEVWAAPNAIWAAPIGGTVGEATVKVTIEDGERKINLGNMVDKDGKEVKEVVDQVRSLLVLLGHSLQEADRILDYQDKDTKGDFEQGARNERMVTLDELQRIEGLKPEVLAGDAERGKRSILPFVTLWPAGGTPGGVNVNTAPAEVLQCLDDKITPQLAASIVARRTQRNQDGEFQHYKSASDLGEIDGMKDIVPLITKYVLVKSSTFEIRAVSTAGGVEKRWLYVVKRDGGGGGGGGAAPAKGASLTLEHQQREDGLKTIVPPPEE